MTSQIDQRSKLTSAMMSRIDLDRLWDVAKRQARTRLYEEVAVDGTAPLWTLAACPLDRDAFALDEFLIDEALELLHAGAFVLEMSTDMGAQT